jgi:molecular chaperone GrpE (heat shock protein)
MNEYHKPNRRKNVNKRRKRRFTEDKQYMYYKGMNQELYCVEALERLIDAVNDAAEVANKIKKLFKN